MKDIAMSFRRAVNVFSLMGKVNLNGTCGIYFINLSAAFDKDNLSELFYELNMSRRLTAISSV